MRRTSDDLRAISVHVLYELEMLFGTANRLREHAKGLTELDWGPHMAYIESFAMHARSLEQFLWRDPSTRFPDDAFAADFLPPGDWATHRERVQRRTLDAFFDPEGAAGLVAAAGRHVGQCRHLTRDRR